MSNPRRAMAVQSLPLDAIGYMIHGDQGLVSILSERWGTTTAAAAIEDMYNALHPEPETNTRARIRKVS